MYLMVSLDKERIASQALSDIAAKRPGTGFAPGKAGKFIGIRLAKNAGADTLVMGEDIE